MSDFLFSSMNSNGTADLYSSDDTAAGTVDLDLAALGFSGTATKFSDFTVFDGKTFFIANATSSAEETTDIFSTDGTVAGTALVSVGAMTGGPFGPTAMAVVNGELLISGKTEFGTPGIWASSDGVHFSEIESGVGTDDLTVSGNIAYFNADLGTTSTGIALWKTNGTAAGTSDIATAPPVGPADFIPIGNGLTAFAALQGNGAPDTLEVTNGTAADTQEVDNENIGFFAINPDIQGASTGTRAVFEATDASGNISVWSTDGTADYNAQGVLTGTQEILVNGPASGPVRTPSGFMNWGDKVLFSSGYALYATDGTQAGTVELGGGNPTNYVGLGSQVFIASADLGSSSQLYVSNGTFAGTVLVKVPGLASINGALTVVGSSVVFAGLDTSGKEALFTSDGTAAGSMELPTAAGVTFNAASPPVIAALPAETTTGGGGGGTGVITLGGGNQTYTAGPGDTIQAGAGNDTITAIGGAVVVLGSSGHLTFFGGSDQSLVTGATGSATIFSGTGGGAFSGGSAGNNVLVSQGASNANTTLNGAGAGDRIFGSAAGNDAIYIGSGRESVLGGGGNTTINGGGAASVIFAGGGSTQIKAGASGDDTIVGGSGALIVTAHGGDAIFGNSGSLNVTASTSGADSIIGGAGALAVNGQGANMLVVAGTKASDILTGNGASLIFTSSGATSVSGGTGSMQVVLGSGISDITEGGGPSTYDVVKGAAGGFDVLNGFKPGTDKIELFGYAQSDLQMTTSGGSTLLSLADGTKISLVGVTNTGNSIIG